MVELKAYDEIAAQFSESRKQPRLPLVSWDIFAFHLQQTNATESDLHQLKSLADKNRWVFDFGELRDIEHDTTIVVTDPNVRIVFSTSNVVAMTGYEAKELIGQSPKMLQGEGTSGNTKATIREAVANLKPFEGIIVNYRKDGTPYDCKVRSFPIFNSKGVLSHFIAFENVA
ncbi:MAG: histidine kinase [Flavobacterium sp. BFFFF1]|uniref:PAS domain-containing protein n=1 Tax=unclassified Flavobacterium TaxID=196869 RepID=UPI000BC5FD98|nr:MULTISPECIES: PAS domain-containing protein [unclassified Flavobacterium]OYU82321.1 MAG: histidine kinase [Flavobacterium sp. BFFFF1]